MAKQHDEGGTLECIEGFAGEVRGVPVLCTEGELVNATDARVGLRPFAFCDPSMTTAERKAQLHAVHHRAAVA
jgi:hypothetical protein